MREQHHETNVVFVNGRWHVFVRRPWGERMTNTTWCGAFKSPFVAHLIAWWNHPRRREDGSNLDAN